MTSLSGVTSFFHANLAMQGVIYIVTVGNSAPRASCVCLPVLPSAECYLCNAILIEFCGLSSTWASGDAVNNGELRNNFLLNRRLFTVYRFLPTRLLFRRSYFQCVPGLIKQCPSMRACDTGSIFCAVVTIVTLHTQRCVTTRFSKQKLSGHSYSQRLRL